MAEVGKTMVLMLMMMMMLMLTVVLMLIGENGAYQHAAEYNK